jgi:D-alanyl-D-alanine carboxypeptidase
MAVGAELDSFGSPGFLKTRLDLAREALGIPGAVLVLAEPGGARIRVASGLAVITHQEPNQEIIQAIQAEEVKETGVALHPARKVPNLAAATRVEGVPMTPDRRFRAASIDKTFLSALVFLLIQDGLLGLDDPVEKWLPGLAPGGREITLRHLLGHRSGLGNLTEHPDFYDDLTRDPKRRRTPEELVRYGLDQPRMFSPGRGALYSNTNYVLAAMMVERATGRDYRDLARERIALPLGLTRTEWPSSPDAGPDYARGYRHDFTVGGRWKDYSDWADPSWCWGWGGVASTADDLLTFFQNLLDGRVVTKESLGRMKDFRPPDGDFGIGSGLFRWGPAIGNDGDYVLGYQGLLVRYQGLDHVVLTNGPPTRLGVMNGPLAIWRRVLGVDPAGFGPKEESAQ